MHIISNNVTKNRQNFWKNTKINTLKLENRRKIQNMPNKSFTLKHGITRIRDRVKITPRKYLRHEISPVKNTSGVEKQKISQISHINTFVTFI